MQYTETETASVPQGCVFITFTTVCYSWMKCKIIYLILESSFFFFISLSPLSFLCNRPLLCSLQLFSSLLMSFTPSLISFMFFLSCVFTFSLLIVLIACLSLSVFEGHGVFPWVVARKIISCWRAGPAVELTASEH